MLSGSWAGRSPAQPRHRRHRRPRGRRRQPPGPPGGEGEIPRAAARHDVEARQVSQLPLDRSAVSRAAARGRTRAGPRGRRLRPPGARRELRPTRSCISSTRWRSTELPPRDRGHGFAIDTTQLRPESRGTIRLRSADPAVHPAIDPNYLATETDRRMMRDGLKLLREICAQPALAPYVGEELRPGPVDHHRRAARRAGARDGRFHLSPGRHLPHGHRRWRRRRSRLDARARNEAACGSPTPRSCRRSSPATPTGRPS